MRLIVLIYLFCLLSFSSALGEVDIDSLRQIWSSDIQSDSVRFRAFNVYYSYYTQGQPDSAFQVAKNHFDLANQKDAVIEKAKALNEQALVCYLKGRYKKAMSLLLLTRDEYEFMNDHIGSARISANIGTICMEQNKFSEAEDYFSESLTIFQEEGQRLSEAAMLNSLGLIYYRIDNFELALQNFNKAITIHREMDNKYKLAESIHNIGLVSYKKAKYQEAIKESQIIMQTVEPSSRLLLGSDFYFLIAQSHRELNNIDSAFFYAYKSLDIDNQIENESRIVEHTTFIADLLLETDLNAATSMAERAMKLFDDDTDNLLKSDLYELLYKCYKAKGMVAQSLQMHEEYAVCKDSVQLEKNRLAWNREAIQMKYEAKLHKADLNFQKDQAKLELDQLRKIYTILFLSFLSIIGILCYTRTIISSNNKKRESLLLELEDLKNKGNNTVEISANAFSLDRDKIEHHLDRKLNETDWKVLSLLLEDPVISNKDIADKIFMSVNGIGSSLRRMYAYFDIKESKYKKISLIMTAIKLSNSVN